MTITTKYLTFREVNRIISSIANDKILSDDEKLLAIRDLIKEFDKELHFRQDVIIRSHFLFVGYLILSLKEISNDNYNKM